MTAPKLTAEEFIAEFRALGASKLAKKYGLNLRTVFDRRRYFERRGYKMDGPESNPNRVKPAHYPWQIDLQIDNGIVLIGSDGHYWPGEPSLMHRAFVAFCKEYRPKAIIINGDVIDGARISRFAPASWGEMANRPELSAELDTAKDRLGEIEKAAFKARKIFCYGNHDERFEKALVSGAKEYAEILGTKLTDHFPLWEICLSCMINDDVYVTHSFKGGEHAAHNNAARSGKTTITGHLHNPKVAPIRDLNGTRWGVDTGMLADPDHLAFIYTRMLPRSWASGFCVLTFRNGLLLQPELVLKFDDDHVQFRGEVIKP